MCPKFISKVGSGKDTNAKNAILSLKTFLKVFVNFEDYAHLLFRFITGEAKYPSSEDSVRPSVCPENKENT